MFKYGKGMKITLGLATAAYVLLPFLMMVLMFSVMFGSIFLLASENGDPGPLFLIPFLGQLLIIPFSLIIWAAHVFLIVAFITHAIHFTQGSELVRIMALSFALFIPYIGVIFYYIVFILMDPPPNWVMASKGVDGA